LRRRKIGFRKAKVPGAARMTIERLDVGVFLKCHLSVK